MTTLLKVILLFAILGNAFIDEQIGGYSVWSKFDLSNLFRGFLNVFEHADWEHVLLNMLLLILHMNLFVEYAFSFL